jgi:hypothetical protein
LCSDLAPSKVTCLASVSAAKAAAVTSQSSDATEAKKVILPISVAKQRNRLMASVRFCLRLSFAETLQPDYYRPFLGHRQSGVNTEPFYSITLYNLNRPPEKSWVFGILE